MHQAPEAGADGPLHGRGDGATGPLTQGERLFTLRYKWPALKHHVGMMTKKSSNSGNFPTYETFKSDTRFNN
jgi:hypothetical protein